MQLITEEYRRLNEGLHSSNKKYGTMGGLYIEDLFRLLKSLDTYDVLDYGCGKSTLADNLPFIIKQYDPAVEKHSDLPEPADVVVCTDVLEHIEPELLDNVLQHIASLAKKACYITACTREARKTLPDGRNAHLIIKDFDWWKSTFEKYFTIKKVNQGINQIIAVLEPKRDSNPSC